MSDQTPILTEKEDGVMLITLNRPERLNAISGGLIAGLISAINQACDDDDVKVIVVTGAGKAFCAGLDLQELEKPAANSKDGKKSGSSAHNQVLIDTMDNCSKPLIGAINGVAVTGGLEMALNFDFMYASETARFGDTHGKVGLMPTWGMSQKLSRIVGINRAREMSLSAKLIDAQTALDWGLVNKVCRPETLLQETMDKAREIAGNQIAAVNGIRKLMNDGWNTTLQEGLTFEIERSLSFNKSVTSSSNMVDRLSEAKKVIANHEMRGYNSSVLNSTLRFLRANLNNINNIN